MTKRYQIKRSSLALAIGLVIAGGAVLAQSAVGSIFGSAKSGSAVTIENTATGLTREIAADGDGRFTFGQLPPGRYKVTSGGVSREVSVSVGTGSSVTLTGEASLETVEVIGSGSVNAIDVSSVESSTVITEEMIDRLPVARNVAAVALLAPGTTRSDNFGGNAISFGGASAAENAYYVNGFNVTNIRNGLAYNEVPFEGIAETQVKTGGYGAEFGRSLGGVTNVITKSGTNTWEFTGSAVWAPDSLRAPTLRGNQETPTSRVTRVEANHEFDSVIYNVTAGGPILKDRLFLYAMYQGDDTSSDIYGTQGTAGGNGLGLLTPRRHERRDASDSKGLVKLDWNISDNHIIEVTGFRDETTTTRLTTTTLTPWGTDDVATVGTTDFITGGDSVSARWTGYLTDNFTLSAMAGDGTYTNASAVPNQNCPFIIDNRDSTQHGCAVQAAFGRDDNGDSRRAYRIDGDWVLGDHALRFGVDQEEIHSIAQNVSSGGLSYEVDTVGDVDLPASIVVPVGTTTIVSTREFSNGGEFDTTNTAWYVEDRWQITDNVLAYLGVRNESFENLNGDGVVFVKVKDTWAPRFGASWDINGDGTQKFFGNGGRYYIPVYANTNVRLSGAELDIQRYYASNGTFTGGEFDLPQLGALLGTVVQSSGVAGDPRSVVDTSLSPLYQDEYILGYQRQLTDSWSAGVRATYRTLGSGMDDYCGYLAPYDWAADNGYSNSAGDILDGTPTSEADAIGEAISHCFLMNPGQDLSINADLDGAGPNGLTQVLIPASELGLPAQTRTYKSVEFIFERAWDDLWTLQGSYTWSRSYGNSEGYVNSEIAQGDSGITADFDFAEFVENATGLLPNNRRHALKVFGAYKLNEEWSFGANLLVQSGRPKNCLGSYAGTIDPEDPGLYPNTSFFCGGQPSPRGSFGTTGWTNTLGLQVAYLPSWAEGLRFSADVFNLFNNDVVTSNRPREAPAVRFDQPLTWQAPRSIRVSVGYDFDLK